MQGITTILGLVAAASMAIAAPANAVSANPAVAQWTIEGFTRTCNAADTSCTVSFTVDTHAGPSPQTGCSYVVTGSPASQTDVKNPVTCGPYSVTSGWSGQFGPGNGFTTWAVVNYAQRLIIFPAYSDSEIKNGVTYTPDKSYSPQTF